VCIFSIIVSIIVIHVQDVSHASYASPGVPNAIHPIPGPNVALQRLEAGILKVLGRRVRLEQRHLKTENSGDNKSEGENKGIRGKEGGTGKQGQYSLSNYEPLLESSRHFIKQCWTECSSISQVGVMYHNNRHDYSSYTH
jgi:hypothetical protein